jgi:putative sterol carrier protein
MTVRYLSAEWHEQARELAARYPAREGVSARMAWVVQGGPEGDIRSFQVIEDGIVTAQGLGEVADPDFTITSTWADATAILRGELDANVAFMQGRTKVAGNMGKLMALLPLTMSDEYRSLQAELQAVTSF